MNIQSRKNFKFPFKRPKEIETLEKEIEKRINNEIQISICETGAELTHLKDEVKLSKDNNKNNTYIAIMEFNNDELNFSKYLHGLFHLDRFTSGIPRLITENSDYGMYIDNCIDHCIITEKVAMYDPDAFKNHKTEILKYIQIDSLKRFVEEDFDPIQKLQLAALMTELAYLHSVDKEANAILAEFRITFPTIEQMRKGIVRYISVKGIATPQAKFGVIEGLWALLGKPEGKYNTYMRFSPKNGFETFFISDGFK